MVMAGTSGNDTTSIWWRVLEDDTFTHLTDLSDNRHKLSNHRYINLKLSEFLSLGGALVHLNKDVTFIDAAPRVQFKLDLSAESKIETGCQFVVKQGSRLFFSPLQKCTDDDYFQYIWDVNSIWYSKRYTTSTVRMRERIDPEIRSEPLQFGFCIVLQKGKDGWKQSELESDQTSVYIALEAFTVDAESKCKLEKRVGSSLFMKSRFVPGFTRFTSGNSTVVFRGLTLEGDIMVSKLKRKSSHKEDEEMDNKLELLLVDGTWSVDEGTSSVEGPWVMDTSRYPSCAFYDDEQHHITLELRQKIFGPDPQPIGPVKARGNPLNICICRDIARV